MEINDKIQEQESTSLQILFFAILFALPHVCLNNNSRG